MTTFTRRRFLTAASAACVGGVAGCGAPGSEADSEGGDGGAGGAGSSSSEDTTSAGDTESETGETAPPTTAQVQDPSEALPTAERALPLPMSPGDLSAEAQSGGPPKDGIPSIDDPKFVDAGDVDFLDPGDPVFGVAQGDTVKAYPQKILVSHEITNDTVDGTPVAVTYCPLTGTVQGFERGETTLGVSGRLINNNLVMYDRASETWWPQIPATAIPGPWNEEPPTTSLREFRLVWTTWLEWKDQHPDTQVLSTDTGYARNYARDPYGSYNPREGYYANANTLFPALNEDDRYQAKRVFMGARTPDGAVAFDKTALLDAGTMTGELGGTPVLAVADPRLSTGYVYLNPDEREFSLDGSEVQGEDGTYTPDDLPITRVHTFDAMWFAWSGYYPNTNVYA